MKAMIVSMAVLLFLLTGPMLVVAMGTVTLGGHWSTASRQSSNQAPDPATTPEAVVQVYAARAFSWRGAFGTHPWFAVKPAGASDYVVYEKIGWRVMRGLPAISIARRTPDGYWFGQKPTILAELRGPAAEAAIAKLDAAAKAYPYNDTYRIWPGPNSNTFAAFVGRAVPELRLDLPPTALGKDYLAPWSLFAPAPSGTGWQLSIFGLAGVLVAVEEGIEFNVLGLTVGIDPLDLAIKLPGLGRLGPGPGAEVDEEILERGRDRQPPG
ncbi:DUF3750 domain-containing protein [Skermanella rosea]|uniref:DUF3750 domain-containing protein n=1 Tax=Skermanella rosea TaxID=1817965 RepID=UPI0019347905|nr:DUF3750 domain-containing protein [Skermanella rosea]UEM02156.1 DUF3750 domain-containing protein [Skermanella rosea]